MGRGSFLTMTLFALLALAATFYFLRLFTPSSSFYPLSCVSICSTAPSELSLLLLALSPLAAELALVRASLSWKALSLAAYLACFASSLALTLAYLSLSFSYFY
jgi:hypothetical protein